MCGVAITGIGHEPLGPQTEAVVGTLDHTPLRCHLGLTDRSLRESSVIRHCRVEAEVAEPAIGQVQVHFIAQSPF